MQKLFNFICQLLVYFLETWESFSENACLFLCLEELPLSLLLLQIYSSNIRVFDPLWLTTPLLGLNLKDAKSVFLSGTYTVIDTAQVFMAAMLWNHRRYSSVDEWKEWGEYKIEFYSSMKKNGIISFAGKWTQLDIIITNESDFRQTYQVFFYLWLLYLYSHV